jgi:hypothetical protein
LLDVLPYGLAAAAAAPAAAVVTALILAESERPVMSVWVYIAGAALLDAVFAAILLGLAAATGYDGGGDAGAIVDVVLGTFFLCLGLFAVFSKESPEKSAAQRERIQRVARGGLGAMLGAGVLVQIINFDALAVFGGALKEVVAADVSTGEAAAAVVFALALMLIPYYAPAIVYMISPSGAGSGLRRMSNWILGHSKVLEIGVGLGFGIGFLWKGIQGLG